MAAERKCPRCGTEVESETLGGLCPHCLLGEGLALEEVRELAEIPASATDVSAPGAGSSRFGDYELLEVIAHGGMGMVYKARQASLNRLVAIKMLLFGAHSSPAAIKRLRAEAVAAASLRHPNIVSIHEVGFCEGQHFLAMDYVEGRPLSALIAGKPLPPRRAATYLRTIAEAIHHAHEHGILHRDLKPSNVLIDQENQPRLIDFGLAKRLESDSHLTGSGQVLGSPNYMSPEQAGGKRGAVTRRSDIYSLGAMLYELLTGRPPFIGEGPAEIVPQVLNTEPLVPRALNPSVPLDLQTVCLKCLEKEPEKRYPTALALAEELARFLEGKPVLARPVGRLGKSWRWCRRQPVRASWAGALVLTLILGSTGVLWQWRRAEQQRATAQANEQRARQSEYAADISLAQHALEANDPGLAISLLDKYQPASSLESGHGPPSPDLRHWEWRYLRQLCQSDESFTLVNHSTWIDALQVSSDGGLLAYRKGAAQVCVWDLEAKRKLSEVPAPAPLWARNFAFVPQSELLAVGSIGPRGEPEVVIWDPRGDQAKERFGVSSPVHALSFSPDGKSLAILHQAGEVTFLEFASKEILKKFPATSHSMVASGNLCFSRDGNRLVMAQFDGRVVVREWRADREPLQIASRDIPSAQFSALAVSPDGDLVAWSHGDFTTNIWLASIKNGKLLAELNGHTEWVEGLAFSPDGRLLASAGADRSIRLWNVAERKEIRRFQGHQDEVSCVSFLPDGKTLVSGGKGGSVRLWSLTATTNNPGHRFLPQRVRGAPVFVANGESFITVCRDGSVRRWDTHSLRELERRSIPGSNILAAALSPDGRWVATADGSGNLGVWDWSTRGVVTNLAIPPTKSVALSFSARSGFLIANAHGWETTTWAPLPAPPDLQRQRVNCTSFAPNEREWASGHWDGKVKLWTFPANELLIEFPGHLERVNALAYAWDGRLLASVGVDEYVNLHDVQSRRHLARFRAHYNAACGVCFSPDGRRLVTFGNTRDCAKLWDLTLLRPLLTFPWENHWHRWAAFSPDGSTLARLDGEGVLEFWHAPSFAELEAAERAKAPPGSNP